MQHSRRIRSVNDLTTKVEHLTVNINFTRRLVAGGGVSPRERLQPFDPFREEVVRLAEPGKVLTHDVPSAVPARPILSSLQDPECRCQLQVRLADSANWGGRGLRTFVPDTCPFRLLRRSRSGLRARLVRGRDQRFDGEGAWTVASVHRYLADS